MYAKLIDHNPVFAPTEVLLNGYYIANPTPETLRSLGYKLLIYPTTTAPYPARAVYTEEADCIRVRFESAPPVPGVPDVRQQNLATLAHADCTTEARIERLEQQLTALVSGQSLLPKLSVQALDVWGSTNLVVIAASAPTRTPDKAGQLYLDTKSRLLYVATGNNLVSDWKAL